MHSTFEQHVKDRLAEIDAKMERVLAKLCDSAGRSVVSFTAPNGRTFASSFTPQPREPSEPNSLDCWPIQITFDLLPESEKSIEFLINRINTQTEPLSELASIFRID